jgi:hypothetical protein
MAKLTCARNVLFFKFYFKFYFAASGQDGWEGVRRYATGKRYAHTAHPKICFNFLFPVFFHCLRFGFDFPTSGQPLFDFVYLGIHFVSSTCINVGFWGGFPWA